MVEVGQTPASFVRAEKQDERARRNVFHTIHCCQEQARGYQHLHCGFRATIRGQSTSLIFDHQADISALCLNHDIECHETHQKLRQILVHREFPLPNILGKYNGILGSVTSRG